MLSWQHALQSKMMRNLVLVVYLAGAVGGYAAHLRIGEAFPDTVAMQETPGAVAYDDADSGSRLDLPHLAPVARPFLPAAALAPRRLAFVPKPDISIGPDTAPVDPELAASEPDPLPVARAAPVRLASLSPTPQMPASSAFAAAFPADGDIAMAAADMPSSENGGAGSPNLAATAETTVVDQAVARGDSQLAPPQAARNDQAPATAQASSSMAHADAAMSGHGAADTPAQSSAAASGASGELPAVAGPPMT